MTHTSLPAAFVRGGTSKGVIVRREDLPADPARRDALLLALMGSPDPYGKQMDGLGGASSSTSKVALVSASSRDDCDVDYLVAQVDVERPIVDYSANCGNLSSAIGPYALRAGLVAPREGITEVRIWQENTARRIIARVPVEQGVPVETGEYRIDGVRGSGARIDLEFLDPAGSAFDTLLPTGRVIETIDVPGLDALDISVIDAGMVMVFVRAEDLGLSGTESKADVDARPALLAHLEAIRGAVATRLGLCARADDAEAATPALPKIAFVGPRVTHRVVGEQTIEAEAIDLVARGVSMGKLHHAYEVTGSIATAAAAVLKGSIVQQVAGLAPAACQRVRIGHASGVIDVMVRTTPGATPALVSATLGRTSRLLMEGTVHVPSFPTACPANEES
ncbi:2-methylaconitate cis-trans isomerase PrpF family protein [Halomonas sp. 707D7]|uniref:2-methylaconitate cis-trans isomerase PrpF family protein n=3 Tax=unclassified Halomonas TaxID=2609666 RepID=UPI00209F357D|nr:PrpF domain-containing protein [Halomonas sp. 707D7]MCP1315152.1 putative methylaconitate Delta-isomerase PrpF [Halomonas sp. 707D7]